MWKKIWVDHIPGETGFVLIYDMLLLWMHNNSKQGFEGLFYCEEYPISLAWAAELTYWSKWELLSLVQGCVNYLLDHLLTKENILENIHSAGKKSSFTHFQFTINVQWALFL